MAKQYSELNPAQKKMAMQKWHQRQNASQPLGPEAKKALLHKRFLAEEVAPGLTRGDMIAATSSASRQKFGEAESELGEASQQNRLQARRSEGWFDQYQAAIAKAGQAQAQNTQAAVTGVRNLQAGMDASAKESWAGQQAGATADAANRGATADPGLADKAHNASNIRNALTGSYGALQLSQGTTAQNALSDRGLTARQQGIEEQRKFTDAGSKLTGRKVRLKRDKGDFKVTYGAQLKDAASKSALENALTLQAAGVKQAEASQKTADAEQTRAETAFLRKYGYLPTGKPSSLEQAKLNYFNKHGYFPPTGPPKKDDGTGSDYKPPTDLQKQSRTSDFRKIARNAEQIKSKIPGWSALSNSAKAEKIYDAIAADYGTTNIDIITAGIQRAVYGHVGPKLRKRLKKLGVNL